MADPLPDIGLDYRFSGFAAPVDNLPTVHVVSDQYTYVWKTDRAWSGTCRTFTVALKDGTRHHAVFELK